VTVWLTILGSEDMQAATYLLCKQDLVSIASESAVCGTLELYYRIILVDTLATTSLDQVFGSPNYISAGGKSVGLA
jgi:hypothetical protein